jgi:hypothetical protein
MTNEMMKMKGNLPFKRRGRGKKVPTHLRSQQLLFLIVAAALTVRHHILTHQVTSIRVRRREFGRAVPHSEGHRSLLLTGITPL